MARQTLLAAVVALLVVTTGCTGVQVLGSDDATPPDVDVVERYESIDTVEATQVTSVEFDGETNETRAAVRIDLSTPPPRQYQRVLAPDGRSGDVSVINESGSLTYDASENAVTRVPVDRELASAQNRSAYFETIVAAARDDEVAAAEGDVSPLPVVPSTQTAASIPADAIDGFAVTYLGTDDIAGRTAHGFELTPASEAAISLEQTLWLDDEHYYPLRTEQVLETGNESIETTTRLTNVTFDADLSDDAFEFDAPENATVETLELATDTFDSIAATRDAADMPVPSPDVPPDYEFVQAQLFGDNITQVALQYASEDGERLTATKMDYVSDQSSVLAGGEDVTVAGNDGRYITTGQSKILTWSCEATQFSLTATALERDQLLAVGQSITCT